jgi:hypothetical protein
MLEAELVFESLCFEHVVREVLLGGNEAKWENRTASLAIGICGCGDRQRWDESIACERCVPGLV